MCKHALRQTGRALAPQQFGVGVAGGAQCIGHTLRAGVLAHPDHVTVATDMRNAFNTIHRTAVLKAGAEPVPQLFAFGMGPNLYQQSSGCMVGRTRAAVVSYRCQAGGPLRASLVFPWFAGCTRNSREGVPWCAPARKSR